MKNFDKFYKLLFQVFVFLLPTQLAYHFWPNWALVQGIRVDYLAPAVYATDLLLVAICCMYYAKSSLPKVPWWIFVFVLINIVVSLRWQISVLKWLKIGELFLLGYLVAKDKSLEIIKPLQYSVVFFVLLAFAQIILGHTVGGIFYWLGERTFNTQTPGISLFSIFGETYLRAYSTFSHPNSMAGFLGVSLLLFILNKSSWWTKITSGVGIAMTFSLGAVIGLIFRKLPVYFLFLLILISFLMPIISSQLLNINYPENITNRLVLWVASGKVFSDHFFFGVGLNNFIVALSQVTVNTQRVWLLQPVHNVISLIASETGLAGLAIFLFGLIKFFKRFNTKYLPIFIFIAVTGMVDHYWFTLQQNLLLLALVVGLSFRTSSD